MLRHGPSQGAVALRRHLGIPAIRFVRTKFRPRPGDIILNWGSKEYPFDDNIVTYINHPGAVDNAQCKLRSYRMFEANDVPCPPFTTSREEAARWLADGKTVVMRRLLRGSAGRGIEVVEPGGALPQAPLYTEYVKKADEYRVHVVDGEVIDVQQKRRRRDYDREIHNQIRNCENGWVYCREEVNCPEVVSDAGRRAVRALGLHFGAADLGFNRHYQAATCYEVNTAPGLEGTTVRRYAGALDDYVARQRRRPVL